MKLQTPVTDSPCKVGISYKDKIMMIGSCFTDNIGSQLKDFGFDVCVNPKSSLCSFRYKTACEQRGIYTGGLRTHRSGRSQVLLILSSHVICPSI